MMESRYFCIVFAQDEDHLAALEDYDLDIFHLTARRTEREGCLVEGLFRLEQVANLVDSGYRVLVEEHESKRARAYDYITTAEEWIKEFEERT